MDSKNSAGMLATGHTTGYDDDYDDDHIDESGMVYDAHGA